MKYFQAHLGTNLMCAIHQQQYEARKICVVQLGTCETGQAVLQLIIGSIEKIFTRNTIV